MKYAFGLGTTIWPITPLTAHTLRDIKSYKHILIRRLDSWRGFKEDHESTHIDPKTRAPIFAARDAVLYQTSTMKAERLAPVLSHFKDMRSAIYGREQTVQLLDTVDDTIPAFSSPFVFPRLPCPHGTVFAGLIPQ